jgi:hypothetical protein
MVLVEVIKLVIKENFLIGWDVLFDFNDVCLFLAPLDGRWLFLKLVNVTEWEYASSIFSTISHPSTFWETVLIVLNRFLDDLTTHDKK